MAAACQAFACAPYFAIVVDGGEWIKLFVTSMEHLQRVAKPGKGKVHWCMTEAYLAQYRAEPNIKSVELAISTNTWWEEPYNNEMQLTSERKRSRIPPRSS